MTTLTRRPEVDPLINMVDRFLTEPMMPNFPALIPALTRLEEGLLPLDISETDTQVIVRALVPGFKREEIEAEITDNILAIKAVRKEEHEEKKERYYRKELRFGTMSRRIPLPSAVMDKDIVAELKEGVLTLKMMKVTKDLPKKIKIA